MGVTIQNGSTATFHYKLRNEEGEVISASPDDNPLVYVHGTGAIIPGLEKELEGRSAGDEFSVNVSSEEGYGARNPELVSVLKREVFQGIDDIEPGMQFQAQDDKGHVQIVTVLAVDGESVTIDRNHPLAGKDLNFEVSVLAVEEKSPETAENKELN